MKPKIIVVLGPTASGKSALAVRIARSLKSAEIISADSRQVYKGLDIGSGKITEAEMKSVRHHLLDVASPKKVFTVAEFQKMGRKTIEEIVARGNVPIICGGSAFYIQGLVDGTVFPEVLPNHALRARLEKMPLQKLQTLLKKKDPRRFAEIDQQNPVRLIRAIEIATALGTVPALPKPKSASYHTLFIGTNIPTEELHKKICKASRHTHERRHDC
jgi:tRNA dimethylallyltransferase